MCGACKARAEKLRVLADEFRRMARDTPLLDFAKLFSSGALDIDALADSVARRCEIFGDQTIEPTNGLESSDSLAIEWL